MGSKRRLAKYILPIILKDRKPDQWFVEPFAGGCNITERVTGPRIANDINYYVMATFREAVSFGWTPPNEIPELFYKEIKDNKSKFPAELVGFVGITCSFGSRFFEGYARNNRGTDYAQEGHNSLIKQVPKLANVVFRSQDYKGLYLPDSSIIYCDPPYKGRKGYRDFDHDEFWQWARDRGAEGHQVFVSEYQAPDDFECIFEQEHVTKMNHKEEVQVVEKLWVPAPKKQNIRVWLTA